MKNTLTPLTINKRTYHYYSLPKLAEAGARIDNLPYSLKILLENALRTHNDADVQTLVSWTPKNDNQQEINFTPARVILQDFTGVPAVADLAAMRDIAPKLGLDPEDINPLQPVELVIDHSVQVDHHGSANALSLNTQIEYQRNTERYRFLKWGQSAFSDFSVVPPNTGIVHQINLECLARVIFVEENLEGQHLLFPDTVVGTDSHTTMINGLGVLGWGVGGIEAEAAMLGQPISMLVPDVVGVELKGQLTDMASATDLVLTVTELLRKKGVVGKFVEFFGEGLSSLTLADRATIANMAPEYGATCGIFPVDDKTLEYLELSGRSKIQIECTEKYFKAQGLFHDENATKAQYSDHIVVQLSQIEPCVAGPKRPQDRITLSQISQSIKALDNVDNNRSATIEIDGERHELKDGHVVLAAITSCTNTSNPYAMISAGLLAKKAVASNLATKPWVKTSLAPGSKVVAQYLRDADLMPALEALNFHLVGFGCTTCIGNSGPLPEAVAKAIDEQHIVAASVLSGNRNFEGRVNPRTRINYLASPMIVVAYAIAGRMGVNFATDPLGQDLEGKAIYLKDIWPSREEVEALLHSHVNADLFASSYQDIFAGDDLWNALESPTGAQFEWQPSSTYIQKPPFFDSMDRQPKDLKDIQDARILAVLGDSITTDHISPAGAIHPESPAGLYLQEQGVKPIDFNSYGSRRGNHEIMMRGTFANIRLRNKMTPEKEGGFTRQWPSGDVATIFDAAMTYTKQDIPLIVIAGKEYGTGSSRDWAAKGPSLLGVQAVIAESFERIHRSNLIGMGILPLQFLPDMNADTLGITGQETMTILGIEKGAQSDFRKSKEVVVELYQDQKRIQAFPVLVRIDTPQELLYVKHGGILQYVLRTL